MPDAKLLVWMDFEANGRKPQVPLEVGLLITTVNAPWNILAEYESVILPGPEDEGWDVDMPEAVVAMHTKNGLLADVAAGRGKPREAVEDDIVALLVSFGKKHDFIIAGSGVGHYDKPKVVEVSFPKIDKWLQYPTLDIGVIRRALGFAGREDLQRAGLTFAGDPRDDKPHRGLADIKDHHAEWVEYGQMFAAIGSYEPEILGRT